jgi:hypothetical protein
VLEWTTFPEVDCQADWAELSCFLVRGRTLSGAGIRQFLNREAGEDEAEAFLENIKAQIGWRTVQMPSLYPFSITEGNIVRTHDWQDLLPYAFMLLLSTSGFYKGATIRGGQWNETAKLFERVVTEFTKRHLGNALNIGSPRLPAEAPKSFRECVPFICKKINERKGQPPRIHWHKDGGVDVIGWRKLDERPGKVVFLIQCAAGENWKTKEEIPVKSWHEWILFATVPLRVLAFPFVFGIQTEPEEEDWRFRCQGRLLMDRLRLGSFSTVDLSTDLRTLLQAWCSNQIDRLPEIEEVAH